MSQKEVSAIRAKLRRALCYVLLLSVFIFSALTSFAVDGCNHQYSVTLIRQATDSESGLRQYTCDLCGYSYTETIRPTGHLWSEWETTKEPTCVEAGEMQRVCTRYPESLHYEYKELPATGEHSYEAASIKQADCEHAGETVYTCSVCGDSYSETVPALGHDYGRWETEMQPSLFKEGLKRRICSRDSSHIEEQTIERRKPNTMDYILSGVLVVGAAGIGYPLIPAAYVLKWYDKKKAEFLKSQKSEL